MSERKVEREREYRGASRPARHWSVGLCSESGRWCIYTVSGFVLPGEWTLARTVDQSQKRDVRRRYGDGTINRRGVVVRGGRGRFKSPPGSGWIGEWMEFFRLLRSTTCLEGLVAVCLMLVLRDPTVVVVGFVSPSKGVGDTASLVVGLAKLGPPLLSDGQVDGVRWLRLHSGWR